jgi:hypothetical protein
VFVNALCTDDLERVVPVLEEVGIHTVDIGEELDLPDVGPSMRTHCLRRLGGGFVRCCLGCSRLHIGTNLKRRLRF